MQDDGAEWPTVLVTGATGFLGSHCVLALLDAGFRVRGTARDPVKGGRIFEVLKPQTTAIDQLEVVAADLTRDEGWDEAVRGCRYILHVASPVFTAPPKDDQEMIGPARDGALRVLAAAARAGVSRVVMTSSTSAVIYGHPRDGRVTYDESTWTEMRPDVGAYERSKTIAERAAWDFAAEHPGTELTTILPGAILGPVLSSDFSPSVEIVRKLMRRELPGCPDLGWAFCDVRDVARAHVAAMTAPLAAGQRFIVASDHVPIVEVAKILERHLGPRGYRIPTRRIPSFVLRMVALWDKTVALAAPDLGKRQDVSSARARQLLGFEPRSVETMVIDAAESLIRCGAVLSPTGQRARSGDSSQHSWPMPS